jgi:hypothetical protein
MVIRKRSVKGLTSVTSHLFGKATVQCLSPLVTLYLRRRRVNQGGDT